MSAPPPLPCECCQLDHPHGLSGCGREPTKPYDFDVEVMWLCESCKPDFAPHVFPTEVKS